MSRFQIINPDALGVPRGWNHGLLAAMGGRLLFIAGQTARDDSGRVVETGFVEQFDRALGNALEVLRAAGGSPDDVGRFTIYVTSLDEYRGSLKPLGGGERRRMGRHYPAMAVVEVRGLVDPEAKGEIGRRSVLGRK